MPKPTVCLPIAFELRISLRYVEPEVWRLIRVPHDIRMDRLHKILQAGLGWTNSHLHQYHIGDPQRGTPSYVGDPGHDDPLGIPGEEAIDNTRDEKKCTLNEFLSKPGDRIVYEYDFGDSWLHEITLEKVYPLTTRLAAALCLDGARAFPPEDCGGPPGYDNLREVLKKPKHPEYAEMIDWLGRGFDPDAFESGATNRALVRTKI